MLSTWAFFDILSGSRVRRRNEFLLPGRHHRDRSAVPAPGCNHTPGQPADRAGPPRDRLRRGPLPTAGRRRGRPEPPQGQDVPRAARPFNRLRGLTAAGRQAQHRDLHRADRHRRPTSARWGPLWIGPAGLLIDVGPLVVSVGLLGAGGGPLGIGSGPLGRQRAAGRQRRAAGRRGAGVHDGLPARRNRLRSSADLAAGRVHRRWAPPAVSGGSDGRAHRGPESSAFMCGLWRERRSCPPRTRVIRVLVRRPPRGSTPVWSIASRPRSCRGASIPRWTAGPSAGFGRGGGGGAAP